MQPGPSASALLPPSIAVLRPLHADAEHPPQAERVLEPDTVVHMILVVLAHADSQANMLLGRWGHSTCSDI